MQRKNFYILLDLDPSIEDPTKIAEALKCKQLKWSKFINHPSLGTESKQNLDLISQIKTLMGDAALRKEEAKQAKAILAKHEKQLNTKINSITKLFSEGSIDVQTLLSIRNKLPELKNLSDVELLKRLKLKLKAVKKKSFKDDGIVPIDSSTMTTINGHLKILGKKDLFDFLNVSRSSTSKTILSKVQEKYSNNKNTNKTAEFTATDKLIGLCKTYLKNDDTIKSYIKGLELSKLKPIFDMVDLVGADKILDADEWEKVIKSAVLEGVKSDTAKFQIEQYCSKKKIKILLGNKVDIEYIQCTNCGNGNEPNQSNCLNCGFMLTPTCPKCTVVNKNNEHSCKKCGFNLRDMSNALSLFQDVKLKLASKLFFEAEVLLNKADLYWPNHSDMPELKSKIGGLKSKYDAFIKELIALSNVKKFKTLQEKVLTNSTLANYPNVIKLKVDAENVLTEAASYCKKAKSSTSPEGKLDYYLSALEVCADFPDAMLGSSSIPVSAPKNLQLKKGSNSINLKWRALESKKAVKYRVLKKRNSAPIHEKDGELLIETSNDTFIDNRIEYGVNFFYSIFSVRGSAVSKSGLVSESMFFTTEVSNLMSTIGSKTVNLKWTKPKHASRIEIYRKSEGYPKKRGDGDLLNSLDNCSLNDTSVFNEKEYCYLIVSVFSDSEDNDHFSKGVLIKAMPIAPPKAIEDLKHSKTGKKISLEWTTVNRGKGQIVRSTNKIKHSLGDVISTSEISVLGSILPNIGKNRAELTQDFQGEVHLTPLVIINSIAVVGKEIILTNIEDVTLASAKASAGRIFVDWKPPKGATCFKVEYSNVDYPSNNPPDTITIDSFTIDEFEKKMAFVVKNPIKENYFFTIYNKTTNGKKVMLSSGTNVIIANKGKINISYSIARRGFLFRDKVIELSYSEAVRKTPLMKVIYKHGSFPTHKQDGELLLTTDAKFDVKDDTYPLTSASYKKGSIIKLILIDDADYAFFQIKHPTKEKLTLK